MAKIKVTSFELHPEGKFLFAVRKIKDDTSQFGPSLKIELESSEENEETGEHFTLLYTVSQKISPKSKLQALIEAVGLMVPAAGEEFDTDDLLGGVFLGTVTHRTTPQGTFANITDAAKRPTKAKARPQPEPDANDPFADN